MTFRIWANLILSAEAHGSKDDCIQASETITYRSVNAFILVESGTQYLSSINFLMVSFQSQKSTYQLTKAISRSLFSKKAFVFSGVAQVTLLEVELTQGWTVMRTKWNQDEQKVPPMCSSDLFLRQQQMPMSLFSMSSAMEWFNPSFPHNTISSSISCITKSISPVVSFLILWSNSWYTTIRPYSGVIGYKVQTAKSKPNSLIWMISGLAQS